MVTSVLVQRTKYPDYPSLDTSRIDDVESYLAARNLLRHAEHVVRLEKMSVTARNMIVRVVMAGRSLILKHFTGWSSNDSSAPPAEARIRAEWQFHRSSRIAECPEKAMPELLHCDMRGRCLVFEDAGDPRPETSNPTPTVGEAESLAWFLIHLHHHTQSVPEYARYDNWGVRQWLATSLFAPALKGEDARPWMRRLIEARPVVREALGEARMALAQDGACLIHGDFLPRNWLSAGGRCRVVDAEFSFFGRPEFDAGSLLAGLIVRRAGPDAVLGALTVLGSGCVRYDPRFVAAFAGAQLASLLDAAHCEGEGPRGACASAMLHKVVRAIESRSLEALN